MGTEVGNAEEDTPPQAIERGKAGKGLRPRVFGTAVYPVTNSFRSSGASEAQDAQDAGYYFS